MVGLSSDTSFVRRLVAAWARLPWLSLTRSAARPARPVWARFVGGVLQQLSAVFNNYNSRMEASVAGSCCATRGVRGGTLALLPRVRLGRVRDG